MQIGDNVMVGGEANSDGSITAETIRSEQKTESAIY